MLDLNIDQNPRSPRARPGRNQPKLRNFNEARVGARARLTPETAEPESVLLQELESLEWQMRRLERVAVIRFTKWMGNRATRLYQRLGHMLLRTPLAGAVHKLMGHSGPEEKYRRWLMQHRAADSGMN